MEKYTYDKLPKPGDVEIDGDIRCEYPRGMYSFLKDALWDNMRVHPLVDILCLTFLVLAVAAVVSSGRVDLLVKALIAVAILKWRQVSAFVRLYNAMKRTGMFPVVTAEGIVHMFKVAGYDDRCLRASLTKWDDVSKLRVYKDFIVIETKDDAVDRDNMEIVYIWSDDIGVLKDKILYLWGNRIGGDESILLYSDKDRDVLTSFISERFGKYEMELHELVTLPGDIHVDVALIPPAEGRNYNTLCTIGAGMYRMDIDRNTRLENYKSEYSEYVIYLPADWNFDNEALEDKANYWPIRRLKDAARISMWTDSWIGAGHTFGDEEGECISEGNPFSDVLLLYPEPPFTTDTVYCNLPSGKTIVFHNLLPITAEEKAYKEEKGVYELLGHIFPEGCDVMETLLERMDCSRPESE